MKLLPAPLLSLSLLALWVMLQGSVDPGNVMLGALVAIILLIGLLRRSHRRAVWAVVAGAVVTLAPLLWLRPAAGTPGLPAHVEALRSEARTYEMACPVHAEGWSLVLTAANSHKV